jgi:hypothetical protein
MKNTAGRAAGVVLFGLGLVAFGPACRLDANLLTHPAFAGGKHRGISYAHGLRRPENRGYGSEASAASLGVLEELGVDWISITPFGFQSTPQDTTIRWGPARFSETDDRLVAVTSQARAAGMRVMLKPHIWLRSPNWVGLIEHTDEAAWNAWFVAYREFILHYARLATRAGIDALCIGNELERTTGREREWRELIAAIRETYAGPITYGAGVDLYDVPFWDALDFIGASAYFPLADSRSPERAALVLAWQPHIVRMRALSARWRKPIVFTELGYRSADYSAWKQWEITRQAPVNLEAQANAYAAFFEAVWPQPWFGGVYWWKWFSFLEDGGPDNNDYTPRGKPAEIVLGRHYAAARSTAVSPGRDAQRLWAWRR